MNKIILTLTLVLPLCMAANTMDTVKVFNHPEQVVIAEDSAGVMMNVKGIAADGDHYDYVYRNDHRSNEQVVTTQTGSDIKFKFPFQREDTTQYRTNNDYRRQIRLLIGGLYFGWGGLNVATGYPAMDEYNKGMRHWGLLYALGVRFQPLRRHYVMAGLGFEGQTYLMKDNMQLVADNQHRITVQPFADGSMSCRSSLNLSTLQVPIIYSLPVVKDLRFTAGPIIDFNIRARIYNTYKTIDSNGYKQTITDEYGKLDIRHVTVDLFGALTYDGIGAFVRYRPMSVFKSGYGPKFNSWSAGLIIAF